MAVNWYWKHKVGEVHYYDTQHKQHWKLQMFGGNMMCAFIYRYKKINEETGKKEGWYNFFIWLNDIEHAKRMLKNDKDAFKGLPIGKHILRKFRLCVTSKEYTYSNKEMLQLAKLLAHYGYKVELY